MAVQPHLGGDGNGVRRAACNTPLQAPSPPIDHHRAIICMALPVLDLRALPPSLRERRPQPHADPSYLPKSGRGSIDGEQAAGRPTNEDDGLVVRRL